ncbi:HD domain-containing protein [Vibrio sp. NTOU-M3]|uniref:HD domain-containing protein n=1 Tax=Vibrio sp. NTOU-M3 TaxID=3234954 RepID=UPI0035A8F5A0
MKITEQFEAQFIEFIQAEMAQDLAHDINHVLRVVKAAKMLCEKEGAIEEVVVPAAYLHDCFSYEKDHPERNQSSTIAANKAIQFLQKINYPEEYLDGIRHAIVAHSYSARVPTRTLEAKIVQDADRLDALGAIGIARCVQVGATLNRALYNTEDTFCAEREPDDSTFILDHMYTKLLKLALAMNTKSAREEADHRTDFMYHYLRQLKSEVSDT